ncbi:hypothetical protein [Mangrovimonas spongiae]|uniref:TonB C-terminal domain-containing protein n=1 Tax=Mangrovimonas spongiae TaxID=2494697 RepID=A0A3R9MDS3_9FLAO|nr:hypothetical protein [Mangrovimonas spongiae]RSK39662.1 hypothetical protein EJA19_07175 [Mangrovimonas spongiae]
MKKTFIAILFLMILSCQTKTKSTQSYLRWVGDIQQNNAIDDSDFRVCKGDDNVLQYFNLSEGPVYKGEKSSILDLFKSQYKPFIDNKQNGYIRLRFIINCKGEAGRFRVLQSDYNYQEKTFDNRIVNQLLTITKNIEKWEILHRDDISVDYYMYLIFKIKEGQLIDILP